MRNSLMGCRKEQLQPAAQEAGAVTSRNTLLGTRQRGLQTCHVLQVRVPETVPDICQLTKPQGQLTGILGWSPLTASRMHQVAQAPQAQVP
jgi:hypothetical protein